MIANRDGDKTKSVVEEVLRESQHRLTSIAETIPYGIIRVDRAGQITFANTAVERILGVSREQIVRRARDDPGWQIISADGSPGPSEEHPFARFMRADRPVHGIEYVIEGPDGRRRFLSVTSAPLHDDRGQLDGCVILLSDITGRKQTEQEPQLETDQLALLYHAGLALNGVLEPRAQLATAFDIVVTALHVDRIDFFRYDPVSSELRVEMTRCYDGETRSDALQALSFPLGREKGLVGWVARQQRALYLPDVGTDPRWITIDPGIQSAIWVPVEHEQRLLGVFCIASLQKNAFSEDDQRLLELLANQLAVALENTRLFDETRQRLAELEAVNRISTALRASETLDEMLPLLLDITLEVLHATQGCIRLYDHAKGELRTAVMRGSGDPAAALAEISEKPNEDIASVVFATGQTYVASDHNLDQRLSEALRQRLSPNTGGAIVPIRVGDTVIGTFGINVPNPRELTPAEVHLLTTLSEIAGNAIQRTGLHEHIERRFHSPRASSPW